MAYLDGKKVKRFVFLLSIILPSFSLQLIDERSIASLPKILNTGGRITGTNVIKELIQELHGSAIAAAEFEGEMKMVAGYAR